MVAVGEITLLLREVEAPLAEAAVRQVPRDRSASPDGARCDRDSAAGQGENIDTPPGSIGNALIHRMLSIISTARDRARR